MTLYYKNNLIALNLMNTKHGLCKKYYFGGKTLLRVNII